MDDRFIHLNNIRNFLIQLAKSGTTTTYGQVEIRCKIPNSRPAPNYYLYDLLTDVGAFEAMFNRPAINILVFNKKNRPGVGFYKWYRARFRDYDKNLHKDPEFLDSYKDICYNFWSEDQNYKLYGGSMIISYSKK